MDSDFDGVANDIELFNGTKTNKRDTDGDKKVITLSGDKGLIQQTPQVLQLK